MHVDRVILCLYKNACDGKQPIFVFVDKIDIIIIIINNIFITDYYYLVTWRLTLERLSLMIRESRAHSSFRDLLTTMEVLTLLQSVATYFPVPERSLIWEHYSKYCYRRDIHTDPTPTPNSWFSVLYWPWCLYWTDYVFQPLFCLICMQRRYESS